VAKTNLEGAMARPGPPWRRHWSNPQIGNKCTIGYIF